MKAIVIVTTDGTGDSADGNVWHASNYLFDSKEAAHRACRVAVGSRTYSVIDGGAGRTIYNVGCTLLIVETLEENVPLNVDFSWWDDDSEEEEDET